MGTSIEGESYEKLAKIVEQSDAGVLQSGSTRNYYVIKIDQRVKGGKMEDKVRAVLEITK